jgi:spore germination protein GerM
MEIKRILPLAALFVLLIVLAVLFFVSGAEEPPLMDPVPVPDETGENPAEPRQTRTITLFFLSDQDKLMHPEKREIYTHELMVFEAKQTIEELIRGSSDGAVACIPPGTRLREVYITRENIAYVDFSRELKDNHGSGTAAEAATVFAIVNTLTRNFESIKRVAIMVEGNELETLNGHIDLTRPLLPRTDLIGN